MYSHLRNILESRDVEISAKQKKAREIIQEADVLLKRAEEVLAKLDREAIETAQIFEAAGQHERIENIDGARLLASDLRAKLEDFRGSELTVLRRKFNVPR